MFVQDNLQNHEVISDKNFPVAKVFMKIIGALVNRLTLLLFGGRASATLKSAD